MVLRISYDLSKFVTISDITCFRDNNEFRYIRHASIRDDLIVACCELGKELNKIIIINYHTLL